MNQPTPNPQPTKLDEINQGLLRYFGAYMRKKAYAPSTVQNYEEVLEIFLKFHRCKPLTQITKSDVHKFTEEYFREKRLTDNYYNQLISALKVATGIFEMNFLKEADLVRPRRPLTLPLILSRAEVESLILHSENLKHRFALSLIYSAGLRRSEILNIALTDIDYDRMIIYIINEKGKKDRDVPLSPSILVMLNRYMKKYKPKKWLFEGIHNKQYSARSLEVIFQQARKAAGINKKASLLTLRHSYATHLLEGGVNLKLIQELLGHKSPKSTQIYTHVGKLDVRKVISPLDQLNPELTH